MRILLGVLLCLAAILPAAADPLKDNVGWIVPGQRIGPARLGMTLGEIDVINQTVGCPVMATYDGDGHAVRLVTEWGGACWVSDRITVGLGFLPVLDAFGQPERVDEDEHYVGSDAVWANYLTLGIAFRVLIFRGAGMMIQAIAIFPGAMPSVQKHR